VDWISVMQKSAAKLSNGIHEATIYGTTFVIWYGTMLGVLHSHAISHCCKRDSKLYYVINWREILMDVLVN